MRQCRDSEKNSKQTYKDHKQTKTNMQLGAAAGPIEIPKTTSILDRNNQKECNKVHARDRNETKTRTAMQMKSIPSS